MRASQEPTPSRIYSGTGTPPGKGSGVSESIEYYENRLDDLLYRYHTAYGRYEVLLPNREWVDMEPTHNLVLHSDEIPAEKVEAAIRRFLARH
jgi:transglutaminase-like putative cysteine protease